MGCYSSTILINGDEYYYGDKIVNINGYKYYLNFQPVNDHLYYYRNDVKRIIDNIDMIIVIDNNRYIIIKNEIGFIKYKDSKIRISFTAPDDILEILKTKLLGGTYKEIIQKIISTFYFNNNILNDSQYKIDNYKNNIYLTENKANKVEEFTEYNNRNIIKKIEKTEKTEKTEKNIKIKKNNSKIKK